MSENLIISFVKSREYEKAFNAIVDTYSERLYWHIRRILCSHEDTNDLMQEVFMKIWKGLPSFRGDSNIYTWIYRIATNEALNHLRRNSHKANLEVEAVDILAGNKIDDDPYFDGDIIQRELHKSIALLPDKQRIVFNLRYFDEMKYEDISKITDTSVGALKASYHFAYNKIKERLEKIFIN